MVDKKGSTSSMDIAKEWHQSLGMYEYEQMFLPDNVDPSLLPKLKSFQFDERDILISTYPRSGTTWTQEMTWLVCNNADVRTAKREDLEERSRFIEFNFRRIGKPNIEFLEVTPAPRVIKTHFPPQFFEMKRQETHFKTIVIIRNLKDVLVSSFHFYVDLMNFKGTWDDFFELFKNDMMLYGSWVKHSLKCWELHADPTVLLLKYEEVKANPEDAIRKIAQFCGKALTEEQLKAVVDYTNVSNMRKVNVSTVRAAVNPDQKKFIRDGLVGGWKKLFNEEQLEYVSDLLKATTEKVGLVFEDNLA